MRLAFITNNAARTPERGRRAPARARGRGGGRGRRHLGPGGGPACWWTGSAPGARVVLPGRRTGLERGAPRGRAGAGRASTRTTPRRSRPATARTCGGARSCGPRCGSATGCRGWRATPTTTIPTAFGVAPGHGVQVEMLRDFAGVEPVVAGKPERPLLDETVRRVGGERPLMVGDRLDTDIEGARRIGLDSLLVLTGVTGLAELVAAHGGAAADVRRARPRRRCWTPHPAPDGRRGRHRSAAGAGTVEDGRSWWPATAAPRTGGGSSAATAWQHLDDVGEPVDLCGSPPPARGSLGRMSEHRPARPRRARGDAARAGAGAHRSRPTSTT